MTDFMITEDFPKNEIEFDERFLSPKACYDYLVTSLIKRIIRGTFQGRFEPK